MGEYGEMCREQRAQKQTVNAANPPRRRCYDWILVSGPCHYAKNRSSFDSYEKLPKPWVIDGHRVLGMGIVKLQLRSDPKSISTSIQVTISDVLHIPDMPCNGFSPERKRTPQRTVLWGTNQVEGFDHGRIYFYATKFCGLWRMALDGNPQGETELASFPKDKHRTLSLAISDEEFYKVYPHMNPVQVPVPVPQKEAAVGKTYFSGMVLNPQLYRE